MNNRSAAAAAAARLLIRQTKKYNADIEEAHREIEGLEREVAKAEAEAMEEAKKLETAQTHFKQLRIALMIEMAQHEQQLEQMDGQLSRLQSELDSSDSMSAGMRSRIENEVEKKWSKVIDEEKARMATELQNAKVDADAKLAEVKAAALGRAQKQFEPVMRALQDKLDHETAVKEEWERKVAELEEELSSLQKEYKDVVDDGRKKIGPRNKAKPVPEDDPDTMAEFDELRATVQALWEILEVDDEEAVSFMMAVQDLAAFSPAALSLYQKEEQRLLKLGSVPASAPAPPPGVPDLRQVVPVPSSSTTTTSSSSSGATATADEAALPSAEPAGATAAPSETRLASAADTLSPDAQPPPPAPEAAEGTAPSPFGFSFF